MRIWAINILKKNNNLVKNKSIENCKNNYLSFDIKDYNEAFDKLYKAEFKTSSPKENKQLLDGLINNLFTLLKSKLTKDTTQKVTFVDYCKELEYEKGSSSLNVKEKLNNITEYLFNGCQNFRFTDNENDKIVFQHVADKNISVKNYYKKMPMTVFRFSSFNKNDNRSILLSQGFEGDIALIRGRMKEEENAYSIHISYFNDLLELKRNDGRVEFFEKDKTEYTIAAKGNQKFLSNSFYERYDRFGKSTYMIGYDTPKAVYDGIIPEINGEFKLVEKDIIKPSDLKNLKYWDDYVLLIRQKDNDYVDLGSDIGAICYSKDSYKIEREKILGSTFSEYDIYFTPITPNNDYKINNDDMIIAVKSCLINVFNKKLREREFLISSEEDTKKTESSDFSKYENTIYSIKECDNLLLKKELSEQFFPEVIYAGRFISKADFVPPELALEIIS